MVRPILRHCLEHGIPIISNFGAANPAGAASLISKIAAQENLRRPRIAIVEGDDLSDTRGQALWQNHIGAVVGGREIVSANAYIGAAAIADALRAGAQVVVTGRVADPALAVGPALAHYNWGASDWDFLARATIAGHLIECGAQVTGGYFADPGLKDVPHLHAVGFPIVEIAADGALAIGKADGTGGLVDCRTVKEQLLYEIHDPSAYVTPDVVADISDAEVVELGPNRVAISGIRGHPRPETLKTIVCFTGGWLGEGEISYAGPNAEGRARLAAEIIRRRTGDSLALRCDLIGVLSAFGDDGGSALAQLTPGRAQDVRLRVAGTHFERAPVDNLLREVTALYTCGPAGGGGVRTALTPRLHSASCFVPRDLVPATFSLLE
jgi:hypothetical protein